MKFEQVIRFDGILTALVEPAKARVRFMRLLLWAGQDDRHNRCPLVHAHGGQPVQLQRQVEGLVEASAGISLQDAIQVDIARAVETAEFRDGVG